MPDNYVVYHLHSDYSLLDSCTDFKAYIDMAVEQGMPAIAFTEHGVPRGWVGKKLYCDEKGIKYIHGVEIYLTEQLLPKVRDNYHTVLLARNYAGVREINRLMQLSSDEDHFYYTNRITFDEFLGLSENIITTSACLASPLNKLPEDHPRYMDLVNRYDYLEIQPHPCDEQVAFNRRLYEISKRTGKPLIAGTDTHSASAYMAECRAALLRYKDKTFGDEDSFDLTWKTRDQLASAFASQGALPPEVFEEAIANTVVMAESVEPFELDRSIKYPILHGSAEADSEAFYALIESCFQEKLDKGIIPAEQAQAFRDAIQEETGVFKKLGMSGFMLSMAELVRWCKSQGMPIGPARGSVGGSRVAYITDIIDLNPETWHTVFSRFCNADREEIGDIDVDCTESDRPKIFRYIIDRFGEAKTARVGAYGTLADLATIDGAGSAMRKWWEIKHHPENFQESKRANWSSYKFDSANPYLLGKVDQIKKEFGASPDDARKKHAELFYYYDGMYGTRVSQSVHPAGIIISPIDLDEEYGVFWKDGERCLVMDMDEAHETGLAKYDFLLLKTVSVLSDTCKLLGVPYPRTHEIDWNDEAVWNDMLESPGALFQMEGDYAFKSLKQYRPHSVFDLCLITASIRPSGASYRDALLAHKPHHNPSELIDALLKNNNGYLVYQEDIIAFLQQVCGLSGSSADTVRRGIARKKPEILEQALPSILNGYCSRSDKPREVAEAECQEFLKIIDDASSYMFGYNHAVAYSLLTYLCAYYRHYHPIQFITAFLNNAANDDDIRNGTLLARHYKIEISSPRFGVSKGDYACDLSKNRIAKGLSSVKFLSSKVAKELFSLSQGRKYARFVDLLSDIAHNTSMDARQLAILIHIDFFADFGNQRELENIAEVFEMFKHGEAKQIRKSQIEGTWMEPIVARHSDGSKKDGSDAAFWKLGDVPEIMRLCEAHIKSLGLRDISIIAKARYFAEAMGYTGYISGRDEDRSLLYIKEVSPLRRKKDNALFGYAVLTQSIGSGIESRFTVFCKDYNFDPIKPGEIIRCMGYRREKGVYFTMTNWQHVIDD